MKGNNKTKKQLLLEMEQLRRRLDTTEWSLKEAKKELQAKITEHKRAEEALENTKQYAQSIVETIREPLVVLTADLKVISANHSFYHTFKVTPEETEGRFIYNIGKRQWDIPVLRELLEEIIPKNTHFNGFKVDHEFPAIGGRTMLLNARRIYRETKGTEMILLAIEDITGRTKWEEALNISETRYRRLFETAQDGILILDADTGQISDVNPFLVEMLGYSHEDLLGKKLWEIGAFKDIEASKAGFSELQNKGYVRYEDLPLETRDGRHIAVEFVSNVYLVDHKKVIQCNIRNITKRKQAEEALQKSESLYHSLFSNMTSGFAYHRVLLNDHGKAIDYLFLEINGAFEKLTGLKKENVIGRKVTEVLPGIEHDPADWIGTYGRVALTGEPIRFENYSEALRKWYSISAHSPEKGYFAVVFEDITERKKTEEALRDSEKRLKRSQEIANLGSWELDLVHNELTWSDEVYRMFGLQPQEFGATYEAFLERVHPDDRAAVDAAYSASLRENRDIYEIEHRVVRNDTADIRVVHEKCEHFRDATGKIIRSVGMVHDITERKQMEEDLRRSRDELEKRVLQRTTELVKANELLERMFSSIDTMIAYMDKDFNFIRVNRAYAEADEREPEFYIGKNHFVLFPNEENEQIFRKVVDTGEPYSVYAKPFEYAAHSEREVTYWDWSLQPVKEPDGSVGGVVLSLVNVTERIRAEESVRQQAALLELAHDAIIVLDINGNVLLWNRGAEQMYDRKKDEALGAAIHNLLESQYPESLDEVKIDLIRKGRWEGELVHTRGDGKKIIVESRWALQRGKEGHPTAVLEINHDITERKELQRRIEATNALLNLFVRIPSRKDYLDAALELIQDWSKCRCAGIRVLNEKGYIPYESYRGFSRPFWESENLLSVKYDQCACIRVVTGTPDPQDHPAMTPAGSFWCNNTFEFVGNLSEEEKARFRGICVQNGFKSVAIIPIRYREKILGAIHLADEKEGSVPLASIEFIESMAPLVGEAVNRFNLEEELRESESRLRLLSSELLTVQEAERKRIAREIHDSIGQTLAAIKFGLESKLSQMGTGAPPPGVSIENLISLAQNGIEESRRIQMDLRPSILDDLGIIATIGWFTREFQIVYSHISVEKQISAQENEVPESLKTALFRVMQEAMNNTAKHSKADLVRLSLRKTVDKVEFSVEDNGEGFDLETIKQGLGLTSMRERTELSGGKFAVQSTPGTGTIIKATWAT